MSIVNGLRSSLDLESGGAIAANLDSLYEYVLRRLIDASAQNDAQPLIEVTDLLLEVKSAWDAMPEDIRQSRSPGDGSVAGQV
jgi:flagellar protein FliS